MSRLHNRWVSKFSDYLLASSGTLITMAGYLVVAFLAPENKAEISVFLILLGYMSATTGLLGHATGPNFMLDGKHENKGIYQILFCNLLVLLVLIFMLLLYNFFQNIISFSLLVCGFTIVFSQIICPFWFSQEEKKLPRIFALLSIMRTFIFIFIVASFRYLKIDFSISVGIFAGISLFTSLKLGGLSLFWHMAHNWKSLIDGAVLYIKEIKPLIIGMQMNLFVSYLMPIFSLIFIEPSQLYMFFIFDRFRYMALAFANSMYVYWQRSAFYVDIGYDVIKKWRITSLIYSVCIFLLFMMAAETLQEYGLISYHEQNVGILIGAASALGVLGSYIGTVECVILKNYEIILSANILSFAVYVISIGPLLIWQGSVGLAIATIFLEIFVLCVLGKYILSVENG